MSARAGIAAGLALALALATPTEHGAVWGYAECTKTFPSWCVHVSTTPAAVVTLRTAPYLDFSEWWAWRTSPRPPPPASLVNPPNG